MNEWMNERTDENIQTYIVVILNVLFIFKLEYYE